MRGFLIIGFGLAAVLLASACKSGPQTQTFGTSSGGGSSAGGGGAPTYTISTVSGITDNNAGLAITLTSNGSKLALGTFAPTGNSSGTAGQIGGGTATCHIGDNANNPYTGPINTYDIWYAESTDGISFPAVIIDTPGYTNQNTSVGLGLDATGKATIAWYGGLPHGPEHGRSAVRRGAVADEARQRLDLRRNGDARQLVQRNGRPQSIRPQRHE